MNPSQTEVLLSHNYRSTPLHCLLVAETGNKIVGIAMAHEWEEYLMSDRQQIRFSTLHVLESFSQN